MHFYSRLKQILNCFAVSTVDGIVQNSVLSPSAACLGFGTDPLFIQIQDPDTQQGKVVNPGRVATLDEAWNSEFKSGG
jgi:hypothetical protein